MNWQSKREGKKLRLEAAAPWLDGKVIQPQAISQVLEASLRSGDRVILEGDNQKQATFLAKALNSVSPDRVNDLTMIIPAISRPEHLDLFEKGIASEINFAYAGVQSLCITVG